VAVRVGEEREELRHEQQRERGGHPPRRPAPDAGARPRAERREGTQRREGKRDVPREGGDRAPRCSRDEVAAVAVAGAAERERHAQRRGEHREVHGLLRRRDEEREGLQRQQRRRREARAAVLRDERDEAVERGHAQ
jgi:hypothetical protein